MQKNIRRKPNKMKTKLNVQINDIVKTRKGVIGKVVKIENFHYYLLVEGYDRLYGVDEHAIKEIVK